MSRARYFAAFDIHFTYAKPFYASDPAGAKDSFACLLHPNFFLPFSYIRTRGITVDSLPDMAGNEAMKAMAATLARFVEK